MASTGGPDGYVPSARSVVELLGLLAYGELLAFDRMAADSRLAPDVERRAAMAQLAASEIANYNALADRIRELGYEPETVMAPFMTAVTDFHDSTAPRDWLEGLVKAYVGDAISYDFHREVAEFLEPADRELVRGVLPDEKHSEFLVREIKAAISQDEAVAGRLALWARRLVGEALTQAQRAASDSEGLTDLIVLGAGDLQAVGELLRRLTNNHAERMKAIGLSN
ncbi:hydroxylase [Natronoglycomyces albus]|uniref:Hydroxylase n=1 Tax=Natronoglycomyces albus TaxID=2811108 RepID=A0A895XTU5_9ACTN|nr:hydroxylase [Natronoglycomyces albus]